MLFAAIWEHYRDKFFEVLVPGGHDTLTSFWQAVSGGEHFLSHELVSTMSWDQLSWCIPLAIHGDGTPGMGVGKAWSKNVDTWSWQSCVVRGALRMSMHWIHT